MNFNVDRVKVPSNKTKTVERPHHYENNGKDLFDEWHERYYNDTKTYTGKEVFAEIMKAVAERYIRRYPNKNAEDIDKGVYTLIRLKEYEGCKNERQNKRID